ncbi:MAG: glutaredoxin 3 [Gammaproteobacteria bacterium]|nr:glutaredoxin 3 [Gammaproteobacteria bacterium]
MSVSAKIVVYATQWCPFCNRARQLLEHKQAKYELIDIGLEPNRRVEMMQLSGGAHTVPQIFINGEHIGGCDDLFALEHRDQLDNKLNPDT